MRELTAMYEARGRFEWDQTSMLIAVVINMMRDPKKNKPVTPPEFNPFRLKKKKQVVQKAPISVLKELFVR